MNSTGRMGESIAAEYLGKLSYQIIATNYRCIYGEIDIIALKAGVLHFIEVKTRKSDRFGPPIEAYTLLKQKRIIKTAWNYLGSHYPEGSYRPVFQFDLIALKLDASNHPLELNFLEHAISW